MSFINKNYLKEVIIDMNSYEKIYKGKNINTGDYILIEEINKDEFYLEMNENLSLEDIIKTLNDEEKNSIIEKYEIDNFIYIIKKNDSKNIKLFRKKIQLTNINLKQINSFPGEEVYKILSFPSGNILILLFDSIKIYNLEFKELQIITNTHNDIIISGCIKDENNFSTCSKDLNIKIWFKEDNKFILYSCIENAHLNTINDIKYFSNGNLVSCSEDQIIKIWFEKNNNKEFQCKLSINESYPLFNLFLLENQNILICMGELGTKFYSINDFQMIKYLENIQTDLSGNQIQKIDDDKIIFAGNEILNIFSLLKNEIINTINIDFNCFSIYVIEDKGIFFTIGDDEFIRVFRNDNFNCIEKRKGSEFGNMYGLIQLKNGFIISFSEDDLIKIWKF